MRPLAVAILLALVGLMCLSAATAEALALQGARSAAFAALFIALAATAVVSEPAVAVPLDRAALALLGLFGAMIAQDHRGPFHPLDLKPLLPVAALLVAPRVALLLRQTDPVRLLWHALTLYVVLAAALLLTGSPETLLRPVGDAERWDVTGSLVAHGSLCTVHAVLSLSYAGRVRSGWRRLACLALALLSLGMAFLTGTRTVLAITALFLLLALRRYEADDRRRLLLWCGGIATALVLHSLLVSDGLLLRLVGSGESYGSGRWQSLPVWLATIADAPFGIGLGGLRETMADGRPALGGDDLLEWPHNEIVRFTVESGALGLVFILGLLTLTVRRAWQAAAGPGSPGADLALVLAADILAESLLQNAFNSVYQATVFLLLIGMLAAPVPRDCSAALTPAPARS